MRFLKRRRMLLACAALMAVVWLTGWWTGIIPQASPQNAFLESVAAGFKDDVRLEIRRIDYTAGQIFVHVKPADRTLTFVVTKAGAKTVLANGKEGEDWSYEWKDETGRVLSLGHIRGAPAEKVHLAVPGL